MTSTSLTDSDIDFMLIGQGSQFLPSIGEDFNECPHPDLGPTAIGSVVICLEGLELEAFTPCCCTTPGSHSGGGNRAYGMGDRMVASKASHSHPDVVATHVKEFAGDGDIGAEAY